MSGPWSMRLCGAGVEYYKPRGLRREGGACRQGGFAFSPSPPLEENSPKNVFPVFSTLLGEKKVLLKSSPQGKERKSSPKRTLLRDPI